MKFAVVFKKFISIFKIILLMIYKNFSMVNQNTNNIKNKTNEKLIKCSFCGGEVDKKLITKDESFGDICILCKTKMKCFQII
jgi:hypothetical protein